MKNLHLYHSVFFLFLLSSLSLPAQVSISNNNSTPHPSAGLDVNFTGKGFLPPRLTFEQRNAMTNPAEGLFIVCTNCAADGSACFSAFLGGQWLNLYGTCTVPDAPAEGDHEASNTLIVWHWNAIPIATGYKWNTTDDYATATDAGSSLNHTETGLTTGNQYTRYVWAYNACGHSEPGILCTQALSCGSSFTRTHTQGTVAPETKTVSYGTALGVLGEPSKCWITRNLGASQAAASVSDDSEAAAGWYWQFNRLTGYKHDGMGVSPGWTITYINENSDWLPFSDPCSIELGTVWRIPTYTEWWNVDNTGGWTNYTGPWNSPLKLHAGGCLDYSNGGLYNRGANGIYWSGTQCIPCLGTKGWYLFINSAFSYMADNAKAYGFSLRCLREF